MIVVDASVIVKMLLDEEYSEKAQSLFADADRRHDTIAAPSLLWFEVTNAIQRRSQRDRFPLLRGLQLLEDFERLSITRVDPPGQHRDALRLANRYTLGGHDAHYVALAELFGCDLWVDDGRLLNAVRGHLPFVRWIGDYPVS